MCTWFYFDRIYHLYIQMQFYNTIGSFKIEATVPVVNCYIGFCNTIVTIVTITVSHHRNIQLLTMLNRKAEYSEFSPGKKVTTGKTFVRVFFFTICENKTEKEKLTFCKLCNVISLSGMEAHMQCKSTEKLINIWFLLHHTQLSLSLRRR
jgi:hypothetical protein